MSDEEMSDEELLGHVRDLHDRLLPRAEAMREMGLEVDAFLAACERLIAVKEGRSDEWLDVTDFMERMQEFHRELDQFHHLERQAEKASAIGAMPKMLDQLAEMVTRLREAGESRTAMELESSVTAARERLARGEVPTEQMEDIQLSITAHGAELQRRSRFRNVVLMLYWESRSPEWWSALPTEDRAKTDRLLAHWRANRERLLGDLPIDDRRRLEALRPEDFDHPDRLRP